MQAARSVASARAQARNTTGATHARASPRRAVSRCLLEKQPEADEMARFPGKFVGGKAPEDLPRHLQERNRISTPWDAARIELAERFGASEAELDKAADISDEHLSDIHWPPGYRLSTRGGASCLLLRFISMSGAFGFVLLQ